ncbi:hypothetical protein [Zavarzinia sp. CC-PAN008]|uniref:hypothetical protein n=1 Tax=Zavarzinia sp. CC-PAN008 TaxID=3243332 RepID=UPI003F746583
MQERLNSLSHGLAGGAPPSPHMIQAALVFATLSLALGIWACFTRGPWYDEFWTLWLADSQVALGQAVSERWLKDPNPPLFVALVRLVDPWIPREVEVRRLLNLVALPPVLGLAWMIWRHQPALRRILVVFAILSASSHYAITTLPDHRSYFLQFCMACLFFLAWLALEAEGGRGPLRRTALAALAVATVLIVNLHTIAGVQALAILAVWWLVLVARHQWGLAMALVVIGLAAVLPQALVMLAQWDLVSALADDFWAAPTGLATALERLARAMGQGMGLNLVGIMLVLAAGVLRFGGGPAPQAKPGLLGALQARGDGGLPVRRLLLVQGLGILAAVGAMLVLNLRTPILIDRYLLLAGVAAAAFLAVAGQAVLTANWLAFGLFLLNAAAVAGHLHWQVAGDGRWRDTARVIQAEVAACPATRVIGRVVPVDLLRPLGVLQDDRVRDGMDYMARDGGFEYAQPIGRDLDVIAPPGACPLVIWSENVNHFVARRDPRAADVLAGLGFQASPARLVGAVVARSGSGVVLILDRGGARAD